MMIVSKKSIFMLMLAAAFSFTSCSDEDRNVDGASGTLHIDLGVDSKIIGSTRADDDTPNVNDFSICIYRGSETTPINNDTIKYGSLSDMSLTAGRYTVKAFYGKLDDEGFEKPYFFGTTDFTISNGEDTYVSLTSALASAKVNISYSETFKTYFKTYSAEAKSVVFASDETRSAYFRPGLVDIYVNVTRQTDKEPIKLFAKALTVDEKHLYNVNLDVDAGTSTLLVSFSDAVSKEETVKVDVSDEALNAPAPYIKAIGFTNGQQMEVTESTLPDVDEVKAYINASSGISKCILTTNSASLLDQGITNVIELTNPTSDETYTLEAKGFKTIGLGANKENIAVVDFTNVFKHMEYFNGDNETELKLSVVDTYNRVNEEFSLKVKSLDNKFAVESTTTVADGAKTIPVTVTYAGDPLKGIDAYYLADYGYHATTFSVASSDGDTHKLLVNMPYEVKEEQTLRFICGRKDAKVTAALAGPVFQLITANSGDVWSNKATLTVKFNDSDFENEVKDKSIIVKIRKDGASTWTTPAQSKAGNAITISDFNSETDATTYYVKAVVEETGKETDTIVITTEAKVQLPNNSFEAWDSIPHSYNAEYYPWNSSDDSTKAWDTVNQTTFQEYSSSLATSYYQYIAISGTMQTDGRNGTNGAIIRTVGWGPVGSNTAGGNALLTKWAGKSYNKTPGELYLGSYDTSTMSPSYGKDFTSRPASVSFYYKYKPCNTDNLVVNVVVENRTDGTVTELASGSFTSGTAVEEYTQKTINLSYSNTALKATHLRIEFKSGVDSWSNTSISDDSLWLEVPPKNNLSTGKYVGSMLYIDDVTLGY